MNRRSDHPNGPFRSATDNVANKQSKAEMSWIKRS